MNATVAPKCPFRATIMTRTFGCEYAEEITRREGPDIACNSNPANRQCVDFFSRLKTDALAELGYEDDLPTMPASVLQQIQFGGLLGLNDAVQGSSGSETVANIFQLMEQAKQKYHQLEDFPYEDCIAAIKACKLKRRRDR